MAQFDTSSLTFNQEEVQGIQNAIMEAMLLHASAPMAQLHNIQTGIKWDTQIPFLGKLIDIGEALGSSCSTPTTSASIPITDKTWAPKKSGFRLDFCADDLSQQLKLFKRQMSALYWWDETNDEVIGFLSAKAIEALENHIYKLNWFGDTAAAETGSGGVFFAGTNLDLFNVRDGLWKQVFADANIPLVTIAKNGEATYAAQLALGATDALDTMRQMHEKADPRMLLDPNLKYYVTRTMSNNFWAYIESKTIDFTTETLNNGTVQFRYRGIPIVIMYEWDRLIQAYQKDGTEYNLPHRALLTTPENIPFGTLDEASLSGVDAFYDKKDKKVYVDTAIQSDVKLLQSYMAVAAY